MEPTKTITEGEINNAADSINLCLELFTAADKRGEKIDPSLITGLYKAESIIEDYKSLFKID